VLLVAIQLTASMLRPPRGAVVLAKYVCYVLIVVFAITGVVAIAQGRIASRRRAGRSRRRCSCSAVSMVAGFDIGFAPYSSDYTRYLPRRDETATIFALSFGGLVSTAARCSNSADC
jgi:NCS1 family nucleobase:cation symporter-1